MRLDNVLNSNRLPFFVFVLVVMSGWTVMEVVVSFQIVLLCGILPTAISLRQNRMLQVHVLRSLLIVLFLYKVYWTDIFFR